MIRLVPLDAIQPNPWNTRLASPDPETVKDLALDIAKNGLLQTPVGRSLPSGRVQLAFGHTRLAAFRWLYDLRHNSDITGDYSEMPVDFRDLSDEQMARLAWAENERRRDHTPVERARAIERRIADFGWTQKQVADELGISRSQVANSLRLLKLPEEMQDNLAQGKISERVAVSLIPIYDMPEEMQKYFRYQIVRTIEEAMTGEITSDQIREFADRLYKEYGRALHGAEWDLDDALDHDEAVSMTCRDCVARQKDRNVCLMPRCFVSRRNKVRADYLAYASKFSGIPALEGDKLIRDMTEFRYHGPTGAWDTVIKNSGCTNLRLVYDESNPTPSEESQRIPAYPNARILCGKRTGFCTCMTAYEATQERRSWAWDSEKCTSVPVMLPARMAVETQPQTAEELAEVARAVKQSRKDATRELAAVQRDVAARIAIALTAGSRKAWVRLAKALHYALGESLKGKTVLEIQTEMCLYFVRQAIFDPSSMDLLKFEANKLLAECGLGPLDDLLPVAQERDDQQPGPIAGLPHNEAGESYWMPTQAEPQGESLLQVFGLDEVGDEP